MVISIFKFLSRYYGIALDAGRECSHKDLKYEFPFIKRCSYEYADSNPDLVGSGEIIYVVDSFNNIVPYICPEEYIMASKDCEFNIIESDDEEIQISLVIEHLHDMPTYKLKEFLHKYKNRCSLRRKIKKELELRGVYENKQYKINREINKMSVEESDLNVKYKRRRKVKYN